jgi:PmbA protein
MDLANHALPTHLSALVDVAHYQKMVQQVLAMAKQQGAEQAEVTVQASQGLQVAVRLQEVDKIEFNRNKAISLTVWVAQRKGTATTTELSEASLKRTVQSALDLARFTEADPCSGLADPASLAQEIPDLALYHPWELSVNEAIAQAKACERFALDYDKKIVNSDGAELYSEQDYFLYANSHGFIGGYPSSQHALNCVVIAQDEAGMERAYQYTQNRQPQQLWSAEQVGTEAASRALSRLAAQKIATQHTPIIFNAETARSLIGHLVQAISGGRLYRQLSFLLDSLGQAVLPAQFDLIERPHLLAGLGSAPFDDDGVATQARTLVEQGILTSYVLSAYSARKLGLANTGNAGGVHNLMLQSQTSMTFAQLLQSMGEGLLVTELMGQGVNLLTGDYSRGASGYWICDGKIQFPVHEITVAGNLKQMLLNLQNMSDDIDTRGNIQTGALLVEGMMVAGS